MQRWKRTLASVMAAMLVLQCSPLNALADEAEPAASSTVQTENSAPIPSEPVQDEAYTTEATSSEATVVPEEAEENDAAVPEADFVPNETADDDTTREPTVQDESTNDTVMQEPAALSEQSDASVRSQEVQLQSGTAIIPAGADETAVKQILFDALVVNKDGIDPQSLEWEYYCTGKNGLLTNDAWGSVNGFTSEKKVVFVTTTFTHPALADNGNASYQIRLKDSTSEVTLTKAEKQTSSITLNKDVSVSLPYREDISIDYDALRQDLFTALVASSTPELTADEVTIEYYATATSGSVGDLGKAWVPLEGGNSLGLSYPAITAGTWTIRLSYAGNDLYAGSSAEVNVTLTERSEAPYTLKETPDSVVLSVNENLDVDYDAVRNSIFHAVIESSDVLTPDNVTIEYYATANSGSVGDLGKAWVPLEGRNGSGLNYPALPAGNQKIRITWPGNQQYSPVAIETEVYVTDRPSPEIQQNDSPAVKLALTEEMQLDTEKLYTDVFHAVIASSTPELTVDDVTITYYAQAETGSLGSLGHAWVPLEGGISSGLSYPSLPAGTQKVRIYWPGNQEYAPITVETNVEVADREQLQFTLKDGSYEVGMIFNDEQGYDYTATAAAIYDAVVASTSPLELSADDVTVEYNVDKTGITDSFKPLNQSDATGLVKFGTGTWEIRISWNGNREYRGNSVTVDVTTTDNRLASNVVLKSGASFTYNMDPAVMKQSILDNVIDWDSSTLPSRDTLTTDNFVIEYKAKLTDIESGVDLGLGDLGNLIDSDMLTQWVPVEGKTYEIGGTVLGAFPAMGAGEAQSIRISYKGNAEYRPSENTEGSVTVNKAKVTVSVHSTNIYADESLPADFVTLNPADKFDVYTIYAGTTSNVTTALYLDLPDRYTNSVFLKVLDPVIEEIYGKSFTQMLNDGMTLGELRELFSTQEILDLLDKLNIDTGTFGQILTVINNLPSITDSLRISFGTPNRAGLYTVGVVTDSQNYETGVGIGFLLVKMRLSGTKLTWNQEISGKLTVEQAKNFDFGATLSYNGDVTISQSGVHYLYSGFTSKWRIYSSTTTPPTEPGSYVVTVCILGGNHFALPITRTFTITK